MCSGVLLKPLKVRTILAMGMTIFSACSPNTPSVSKTHNLESQPAVLSASTAQTINHDGIDFNLMSTKVSVETFDTDATLETLQQAASTDEEINEQFNYELSAPEVEALKTTGQVELLVDIPESTELKMKLGLLDAISTDPRIQVYRAATQSGLYLFTIGNGTGDDIGDDADLIESISISTQN